MTTTFGVTFGGFAPLGPQIAVAVGAHASELGYGSFWTAEASGPEAFATLAAVGAAAPDLDLGTGILPLQVRSPTVAAMGAATLQALHPDRTVWLGVGVSSPVITERWHGVGYGERPLSQAREYLTVVRGLLEGEAVSYDGEHYRLSGARVGVRLGERRPKLVLAALNPGMLRLAGELADGVLLTSTTCRRATSLRRSTRCAPESAVPSARTAPARSTRWSMPASRTGRRPGTAPAVTCGHTPS